MERKKSSITAMDRTIRALTHCMHVQCLLAHGRIRNQWINDEEVKGILLSMVPQSVLSIWNREDPDKHFSRLLDTLQKWWRIKFKITKPGLRKVGYTSIASKDEPSAKEDHVYDEVFRSIHDFRETAAKLEGSRDLGAQLFTSLLRAIGIDARMVFSLQPLGYGFGKFEDAPKRKKRKKKPPIPDADLPYPFFWTEWFPVETLVLRNCDTSNPDNYEPRGKIAEERRMVMCYVVAFEEDGCAKDVTMRYVKNFPGKAKAFRVWPTSKARGNKVETQDWWRDVITPLMRPERTERDEKEDKTLQKVTEKKTKAPTTIGAYKDHPEFVLERHLKREEAMKPDAKPVRELAVGKGEKAKTEKIYRRAEIELVFGVEAWYKEGRKVKVGEEPLKKVKARAVTLTRKREHEQQMAENEGPVLQGLYAKYQTELYRPPPVVNGAIPKNSYGNADCFVPTMIPEGAIHLPHRGIAKVAKKLGIDYAEAITGFEFKSQRAIPVATGVLVATENADMLMEAFREAEQIRLEKESGKRQAEALKKWRKFIVGMRIRERLRDEYGNDHEGLKKHEERQSEFAHVEEDGGHGEFVTDAHVKDDEEKVDAFGRDFGGGFLPEGMDVELLPEKRGVLDEET
ncbi:Rad4-domain-containing protein [Saitoella complicata NRRL Y-17804]|uniref:Rad4-domain-containing protein n=1 Tax=Saitoella complicata (strain BCRC 22490 / CBS 7301 / JCM 7358 / NBRC 10748 / NRRL Y-17804) TaxID=698492 RepID=UPI000866B3A3|nr:Rad4-domain-containing protein [Saitoella complicata NRRL Y-17804]ODQ51617.1 Rad4-domain-containing protein [Saitoella complicata NRRL Y-17804]